MRKNPRTRAQERETEPVQERETETAVPKNVPENVPSTEAGPAPSEAGPASRVVRSASTFEAGFKFNGIKF